MILAGLEIVVTPTRTLTFLWTPWSAGVSILVVLVTAGLCFAAWRRSGYRTSIGFLELLRLVIVVMAAVMFNQPEWIEEFRPEEKPTVGVLWDDSTSMDTRDVVPAGSAGQPTTRRDAVAGLADAAAWSQLQERWNVVIQPFASAQPTRSIDRSR